jgi:hypothetical protein
MEYEPNKFKEKSIKAKKREHSKGIFIRIPASVYLIYELRAKELNITPYFLYRKAIIKESFIDEPGDNEEIKKSVELARIDKIDTEFGEIFRISKRAMLFFDNFRKDVLFTLNHESIADNKKIEHIALDLEPIFLKYGSGSPEFIQSLDYLKEVTKFRPGFYNAVMDIRNRPSKISDVSPLPLSCSDVMKGVIEKKEKEKRKKERKEFLK